MARRKRHIRHKLLLEELEPRLLFSAGLATIGSELLTASQAHLIIAPLQANLTPGSSGQTQLTSAAVSYTSPPLTVEKDQGQTDADVDAGTQLDSATFSGGGRSDFLSALADPSVPQVEQRVIGADGDFTNTTGSLQHARSEVVFLDLRVQGYQQILADIQKQNTDGRSVEVVLLDAERDGVTQIGDFLSQHHDIDAVHIISHGSAGSVELGSGQLNFDSLLQNASAIKQWGNALTSEADILIYVCDLASSQEGQSLIGALSKLTGADVAASDDKTGAAALGGDWVLEYHTGIIQAQVAISEYGQQNWNGVLATYTVTTTTDSGDGSLRQAITDANTNAGIDSIIFNIAGSGVQTIAVSTWLPSITSAVVIDGTTQPGYAGTPIIELNGAATTYNGVQAGLVITGGGTTIKGLVINSFAVDGIRLQGGSGNVIQGNYIGTDATGQLDLGNGYDGIFIVSGSTNNTIGGPNAADRNVISGNNDEGIEINGGLSNLIQGNYIGLAADGMSALSNVSDGVLVTSGTLNQVLQNRIATNGGLGINLAGGTQDAYNVTANDAGDADSGANNLQNFPVLTSAVTNGPQITLTGSLNSTASSYCRIEFFTSSAADAAGYGEGQRYLGFVNVATDGSGNATFNTTLTAAVAAGEFVSATATMTNAGYTTFTDTSEFAQNRTATASTNNAPVLDASKSPTLTAQNEDSGAPVGAVGTLVSTLMDFASPTGQVDNVTDPDASALLGIAVTATDTTNGTWYYSTNNGTNWNALGAVSNASARLLAADANTRLYFQSNANYNGTLASAITFRAWDQTTGSNGSLAGTSTSGGETAVSTATDTASLTVNAVNDAPTTTLVTLTAIAEDSGVRVITQAELLANASDVDGPGMTATALAIASGNGNLVNNGNGTWNYTPALNDDTSVSFNYTVTDGSLTAAGSATLDITTVNDAPMITSNGGGSTAATNCPENTTAVTTVTASDVDLPAQTLTFSIVGGVNADKFAIDSSTGALRFINPPDYENPQGGAGNNSIIYDVTVGVSDGVVTGTQAISIIVWDVNDAPVVNTTGAALGYFENDTATVVDPGVTISDQDSTNLVRATATIFSNYVSGQDVLAFTNQLGITGNWNAGTGVLTLSGTTTVANYQTALRSVTYFNSSDAPSTLARTVSFIVDDGSASSTAAIRTVTVTAVNDAPTVTDRALSFDGTDLVVVAPQPNLVMTSTLTIEAMVQSSGALSGTQIIVNKEGEYEIGISANGKLQWAFANTTPVWNWVETSFTVPADTWVHLAVTYNGGVVKAYSNGTLVDTYNGNGTVGDVYPAMNDLTIGGRQNASTQRFTGLIDEVRVWNVERSDTQIQTAYNAVLTGAEAGLVGYWRFSESSGPTAVDSSTQGNNGVLGNGVAADVPTRTVNLDYTTAEDNALVVAGPGVLTRATDPEGSALTATLVSGPANAAAFTLNPDGSFSYTPTANFNGIDSFVFTASDGALSSQPANVYLTVTPVNDAPVASGSATLAAINEDTASPPGATVSSLFGANFSDATDQVAGGSSANTLAGVAISGYTVDAAKGDWQYSTNAGSSWTTLTGASTTTALTLDATHLLRFVPTTNNSGLATALSVNLIDSGQTITSGATLNLSGAMGGTTRISAATVALDETIMAVNDAPTATNLSAPETYTEDTALNLTDIVVSDVDTSVTVTLMLSDAAAGTLTTRTTGAVTSTFAGGVWTASGAIGYVNALLAGVTFTPSLNYNSNFTITTSVSDGIAAPVTGVKAVTGTPVNDSPLLANTITNTSSLQDVMLNTQFAANTFLDIDGDMLGYTASLANGAALPPWLSFDTLTRRFTGTPSNVDVGNHIIRITAADGNGAQVATMFTVSVINVNDAPIAQDDSVTAVSGSVAVIAKTSLAANDSDIDGDTLTVVDFSQPQNGELVDYGDGTLHYIPSAGFIGSDSFTYTVLDGQGGVHSATVSLIVVQSPITILPGTVNAPIVTTISLVTNAPIVTVQTDQDNGTLSGEDEQPVSGDLPLRLAHGTDTEADEAVSTEKTELDIPVTADSADPISGKAVTIANVTGQVAVPARLQANVGHIVIDRKALSVSMNAIQEQITEMSQTHTATERLAVHIVSGTTFTLSAGFVAWILRSGSLLASFMSTLPLWKGFDPLPILAAGARRKTARDDDDDDHGPDRNLRRPDPEDELDRLFGKMGQDSAGRGAGEGNT